jgi:AcrR family transcriptional regulator
MGEVFMANVEVKESDRSMVSARDEKLVGRLAADQQNAMELLVMGKSIAETARSAGVSRTTIYHWLRNDPVFQAAYNQWHDQLEESCRSRLMTLTDKATDAVEKALESGDARAALQLLKGMGMIRPKAIGPTDAEEAKKRMEIERRKRASRLMFDEMEADVG